jgi:hypothetical protein
VFTTAICRPAIKHPNNYQQFRNGSTTVYTAEITTLKRYRPHLSRSASKQLTKGRKNEWQKEGKRKKDASFQASAAV